MRLAVREVILPPVRTLNIGVEMIEQGSLISAIIPTILL